MPFLVVIVGALLVAGALVGLNFTNIFKSMPSGSEVIILAVGVATILFIWINLATTVKRLKDANFSPWLALLNLIPYLGALIVFILNAFFPSVEHGNKYCNSKDNLSARAILWIYIIFLLPIALIIMSIVVPKIINKNDINTNIANEMMHEKVAKSPDTTKDSKSSNNVEKTWSYKKWEMRQDNYYIRYITNGKVAKGNQFGFVKSSTDCSLNILWLSIYTMETEENIKKFIGKSGIFEVSVDREKFTIESSISEVHKFTENSSIVLFNDFSANENFISLLKKGTEISFRIIGSTDLVKLFDVPSEQFSLEGFTAAYLKATERCLSSISDDAQKK